MKVKHIVITVEVPSGTIMSREIAKVVQQFLESKRVPFQVRVSVTTIENAAADYPPMIEGVREDS